MSRAMWCLALAGCSFRGAAIVDGAIANGDAPDIDAEMMIDGAPPLLDATISIDATQLTCLQKWQTGVAMLGNVTPLAALNTTDSERDVWLTLDEKTVYFARGRSTPRVWYATRGDPSQPFGTPMQTDLGDSGYAESKFSMAMDNKTAAVTTSPTPGGAYDVGLYTISTAPKTFTYDGSISAATGGGSSNWDPYITPDAKGLYWAPGSPQMISHAKRSTTSVIFAFDRVLAELGSAGDPAPSFDETVMLYSQSGTLAYATRIDATMQFTPVGAVPGVHGTDPGATEGDAHLSKDACRLYFGRATTAVDWDLFEATVL